MDRQGELYGRVGVFLGALRCYTSSNSVDKLDFSDPILKTVQTEIYALLDAGFSRGAVIGTIAEQMNLRSEQEPYRNPAFREGAVDIVRIAYRRAKLEEMAARVPKTDIEHGQIERVAKGILEYRRRLTDGDPLFDDSEKRALEGDIRAAAGVLAKHGASSSRISNAVTNYLDNQREHIDNKLLSRLIREGIEEQVEAEIRAA